MDTEDLHKVPLSFENDQYVLKPIINKSIPERASSDICSTSSPSLSHKHQDVKTSGKKKSRGSKRKKKLPSVSGNQNLTSASPAGTKEKRGTAEKKKQVLHMQKNFCTPCGVQLSSGNYRSHALGKQHMVKAPSQISKTCSITVLGFRSNTTEEVLYNYFSTFGIVRTVVIYIELERYAVIEFMEKCSVGHAAGYFASHKLGSSNLTVIEGLSLETAPNPVLNEHASGSQKISSQMKRVGNPRIYQKERCTVCGVEFNAGNCREHYLSSRHTQIAYFRFRQNFCITVTGFHRNTKVQALYDYFSHAGRLITIVIFHEKGFCALVEYLERCSVSHVLNCDTPHVLESCKLVVQPGMPFGGCLPNLPAYISENLDSTKNLSCKQMKMKNTVVTPEKGLKAQINVSSNKAKVKALNKIRIACRVCSVRMGAGDRRSHYISKGHLQKSIPLMRESCCVTVAGCPATFTKEHLYDYFNSYENVQTIDMRRLMEGLVTVEFENQFPLKGVVDRVNKVIIGMTTVTMIRGCPSPITAPLSTISHDDKMHLQQKQKTQQGLLPNPSGCVLCNVFFTPVQRRQHFLSNGHLKKAIPLMKESQCVTVACCSATFTKEDIYDYFNTFENVQAVDTRRLMEGFVIVEFENHFPLKGVLEWVKKLEIGNSPVTVIRGCPSLGTATQSTVSHDDKKHRQQEQKTVVSCSASHTVSTVSRTLDSLIKNEFVDAMKARSLQESSVETVTEDADASSSKGCTSSDEAVSESAAPNNEATSESAAPNNEATSESAASNNEATSESASPNNEATSESAAPNNEPTSESAAPNNEIKQGQQPKPLMCDVCNLFIRPEDTRVHHLSKKHTENANRFIRLDRCLTVKGLSKDTTTANVYDYFSQFGKVEVVVIPKNKETGALVGFYSRSPASSIAKANGSLVLKSNQLSVEQGHKLIFGRGHRLERLPAHDQLMSSLQKYETVEDQISYLKSSLLLTKQNMEARINSCNLILELLRPFFPSCVLHLFGSSVNSFGFKGSDMDILFEADPDLPCVVEKEEPSKTKVKSPCLADVNKGHFSVQDLVASPKLVQLDFIKKVFRKGSREFRHVIFVSSAACPVVKFISKTYGLSCDLSNGNKLSLYNTALLRTFGMLDERVIPLVTTLRYWAKKFNYICTRNFSSYAFTLLVIFFLQTREPCVLPSVQHLRSYTDEKMMVANIDCSFCSDPMKIEISSNSETIESLLFDFFEYYGWFDYSNFVISPLTGRCELVELFECSDPASSKNFKISAVCIQDPFLLCRNVSSFVKKDSLAGMTEHMRKITRERYDYFQKQNKLPTESQSILWGIPEIFAIMPKNLKVSKKKLNVNPFSKVVIRLTNQMMKNVKRKYNITCKNCINLSDIAIHEVCRLVIDVMRVLLLFATEITYDERDHYEWVIKAENSGFSCTCSKACGATDDMHNENYDDDLHEMSDSSSTDLSNLGEGPTENCPEVKRRSCSVDSASQYSNAELSSDEESNENVLDEQGLTVSTEVQEDVLDTQDSASPKKVSPEVKDRSVDSPSQDSDAELSSDESNENVLDEQGLTVSTEVREDVLDTQDSASPKKVSPEVKDRSVDSPSQDSDAELSSDEESSDNVLDEQGLTISTEVQEDVLDAHDSASSTKVPEDILDEQGLTISTEVQEDVLDAQDSASPTKVPEDILDEQGSTISAPEDILDAQIPANSTEEPKKLDISQQKEFLVFGFTATHATWCFRKKYRKQCSTKGDAIEIEKNTSQKITEDETLKLKKPSRFRCEFYDLSCGKLPVLCLKVTPPEQSPCWKPLTSFLKCYLPKMVERLLRC